jgi:hypothetical protein
MKKCFLGENFINFIWVNFGKIRRFFHKMELKAFKGGSLVLALSRSKK